MISSLDHTKDELIKRLTAAEKEKHTEASDKAVLSQDVQQIKHITLLKDNEIQDLRNTVAQLDAQIDSLQNEIDQQAEELFQ